MLVLVLVLVTGAGGAVGSFVTGLAKARGGTLQLEALDFYRRALRVVGLNTLRHDAVRAAAVLREVCPAIQEDLRAPRVARTVSLSGVREAYAAVQAGRTGGRVVLVPGGG